MRPLTTSDFLAGFLLFRVLKMGSDSRFDTIRAHFFKFLGMYIGLGEKKHLSRQSILHYHDRFLDRYVVLCAG